MFKCIITRVHLLILQLEKKYSKEYHLIAQYLNKN